MNNYDWNNVFGGTGLGLELLRSDYEVVRGLRSSTKMVVQCTPQPLNMLLKNGFIYFFDLDVAFARDVDVDEVVPQYMSALVAREVDTCCIASSFIEYLSVDEDVFKSNGVDLNYYHTALMVLRWLEHQGGKSYPLNIESPDFSLISGELDKGDVVNVAIKSCKSATSENTVSCLLKKTRFNLGSVNPAFKDFYLSSDDYLTFQRSVECGDVSVDSDIVIFEIALIIKSVGDKLRFGFFSTRLVLNESTEPPFDKYLEGNVDEHVSPYLACIVKHLVKM